MSGYIEITENKKINNRNVISFKCSRNLENFFNTLEYYTDYEFNIGDIPDSILNISFICNILPILWLTNSKLIVKSIDKDFFESVEKIKSGYEKMYPNIEFYKTKIEFQHIEKNIINHTEKYGMFFSGGIDAYSMLFEHIEENPLLITVWGADIETYNEKGWNCTKNNIEVTSKMFDLENQYIKSNFKEFLNTSELNKLIVKSNDKWWHGFQHGIGLIGLAATIAYKEKLKKIYIASSYPIEANVTCASHPTIDNNVSFCGIQVIHDQAELNRQEKIQLIVDYTSTTNKFPNIHVCWKNTSGENCCVCEKCCRTIVGILVSNGNPVKYGFLENNIEKIKKYMNFINDIDGVIAPIWMDIIDYYKTHKKGNMYTNELEWLEQFNPYRNRTILKKIIRNGKKIYAKFK